MTELVRSKTFAALALLAAAMLSGCGGSADADTTASPAERRAAAQQLIAQVHDVNPKAGSGRIDATIDLHVKGDSRFAGTTEITASGAWNLPDGATVPDLELDVGLSLNDAALGGTLVVADGKGYIKLGNSGYKLPDTISRDLVAPARDAQNGLTKTAAMFYVNPQNWQRSAELVGETTVAGERVQKITGEIDPDLAFLDLARLVRFLTSINVTQALGLPTELGPELRAALVRSVTLAKGAVWIGSSDNVLRKAHLVGKGVVAPRDRELLFGATSAALDATVNISDVGRPQVISAPTQLEPYSSLQLSLSALAEGVRRQTQRAERAR